MEPAVDLAAPAPRPPWVFPGARAALATLGWAWSLQLAGTGHHGLPLQARVLMWITMMVGMMVPPEVPTLLRLAHDGGSERWRGVGNASALLGGYLAVWAMGSVCLALLDARLGALGLMTHEMASRSVPLNVAILATAGLVQLSPWKSACLQRCRSIPEELRRTGRPLEAGLRHGMASVSSCGVLMLVLLVVGAMNWTAIGVLTGFLVAERLVPASASTKLSGLTGAGLLLWAGWLVVSTVPS